MILSNAILLRKTVNWSMLVHGIAIPLEQQRLYASLVGEPLQVGARHDIKVLIDGEYFDALCVEAHHIDPFTSSLNNDYSNIIILSPTYHRIIHKANPVFDRENLSFKYPNGLVERVRVNKHL